MLIDIVVGVQTIVFLKWVKGPNGALTTIKYAHLDGFKSIHSFWEIMVIPAKNAISHSYISCHCGLLSELSSFAICQNFNIIGSQLFLKQIKLISNLEIDTVCMLS